MARKRHKFESIQKFAAFYLGTNLSSSLHSHPANLSYYNTLFSRGCGPKYKRDVHQMSCSLFELSKLLSITIKLFLTSFYLFSLFVCSFCSSFLMKSSVTVHSRFAARTRTLWSDHCDQTARGATSDDPLPPCTDRPSLFPVPARLTHSSSICVVVPLASLRQSARSLSPLAAALSVRPHPAHPPAAPTALSARLSARLDSRPCASCSCAPFAVMCL